MAHDCHPIAQPITRIDVDANHGHAVGHDGVTRIEATTKPGLHCDIPYLAVWAGDHAVAEFCQHAIVGVHFGPPE